jgi:hypothetical protein
MSFVSWNYSGVGVKFYKSNSCNFIMQIFNSTNTYMSEGGPLLRREFISGEIKDIADE